MISYRFTNKKKYLYLNKNIIILKKYFCFYYKIYYLNYIVSTAACFRLERFRKKKVFCHKIVQKAERCERWAYLKIFRQATIFLSASPLLILRYVGWGVTVHLETFTFRLFDIQNNLISVINQLFFLFNKGNFKSLYLK